MLEHEGKASSKSSVTRVAIASLGAVGLKLAQVLDAGFDGYRLTAVSARNRDAAATRVAGFKNPPQVLPIEDLEACADLVIECAPAEFFADIAEPFLRAGKTVVALSAGAVIRNENLLQIAADHGGRIMVPSGALLGLDAVAAAAQGNIESVRMITRKPVRGLLGAPHLVTHGIDITGITAPMKIFDGTAREAAVGFPANLNVAVALSLAGIGPDHTQLEIWADPALQRNMHQIKVVSDSAHFSMEIENIPSENPKTGRITAQSVLALLCKLNSPLQVGT
ncbi:aspartate dehydrogenase [Sulfitobacter dubius]|uniref:L-aspartate dehydrogenase n=1 Tax=Sulfitobacter dubius TaxID=218673 RepID=A0ABY3ZLF6_9RHOB|nr:aspartate dehydrogenase [Sulfitobacter dubius]UOA14979.1 L-aspartate dehydrogenase [Sulfitobacter dubius]